MVVFSCLSKTDHPKHPLDSVSTKINKFWYDLCLCYTREVDSVLLCVCSVSRKSQNVVRTKVVDSVIALCATILSLINTLIDKVVVFDTSIGSEFFDTPSRSEFFEIFVAPVNQWPRIDAV